MTSNFLAAQGKQGLIRSVSRVPAMDCYRLVGEDQLAGIYAHEVTNSSTDHDELGRKPMRIAEARVALGVLAGRGGDRDGALMHSLVSGSSIR